MRAATGSLQPRGRAQPGELGGGGKARWHRARSGGNRQSAAPHPSASPTSPARPCSQNDRREARCVRSIHARSKQVAWAQPLPARRAGGSSTSAFWCLPASRPRLPASAEPCSLLKLSVEDVLQQPGVESLLMGATPPFTRRPLAPPPLNPCASTGTVGPQSCRPPTLHPCCPSTPTPA